MENFLTTLYYIVKNIRNVPHICFCKISVKCNSWKLLAYLDVPPVLNVLYQYNTSLFVTELLFLTQILQSSVEMQIVEYPPK
jgi:hypothetical protein